MIKLNSSRSLFLQAVITFTLLFSFTAQAQLHSNKPCKEKIRSLGAKDPGTLEYFCDGRQIDYACLDQAVYKESRTAYEALPLCSKVESGDEIVVTRSSLTSSEGSEQLRSDVNIWNGPNLIVALSLVALLDTEKSCIPGPFIDGGGHKVLGHGLGNAVGTALIGWAVNNCDVGVKTMIGVSVAREQMKINLGANCEWSSMAWDAAGITGGGAFCKWFNKNVARPKFLQEFSERIFGRNSSLTILPQGRVKMNKAF